MYIPAPDEKTTLVMLYTHNAMLRGEVVTKESVRVSTWLRTQGAPRYIHMLRASIIQFAAGGIKTINAPEIFVPIETAIAMHLAPPQSDPVDYDENERNRAMLPVVVGVGAFQFKCLARVSAQTGLGPSLELSKIPWMSLYELEISSPFLPQMPAMRANIAVVNPSQVYFALPEEK